MMMMMIIFMNIIIIILITNSDSWLHALMNMFDLLVKLIKYGNLILINISVF